MYQVAIIIALILVIIFFITRLNKKKKNTDIKSNADDKLYFSSDTDLIYYNKELSIKSAYVINLTKYNGDYTNIINNPKMLKKILKINVIDYFQQFNLKTINYNWYKLANDMHTDFTDALLVISH